MKIKTLVNLIIILMYVLLNSFGALAIKTGVNRLGEVQIGSPKSFLSYFVQLFSMPATLLGFTAIGLSAFVWMTALSRMDIIGAYPISISLNFLVVVFFGLTLFHEHPSTFQIVGIIMVFMGVVFLSIEGK